MLEFTRTQEFLVGVDSDGCAFDTMEVKHKECFIPNTIGYMGLQGVSKFAREAAEFVNLYSRSRGINRFPALVETLQWLRRRPEVRARGVNIEIPRVLTDWIARETKLGNPALQKAVDETHSGELKNILEWSLAINRSVESLVHGVPPFPMVRESIAALCRRADIIVVSATPHEALVREWKEHDLDGFVAVVCGQEIGTKEECLGCASQYPPGHALMIGDAPGDYRAARANHALFYPINPGDEESSWQRFFDEGIERFFAGTFAGDYQERIVAEFDRHLPEAPPWPVLDKA